MLGPRKPSLTIFFVRILSAVSGGVVGALAIFAIYVFGLAISTQSTQETVTVFLILIMVFMGALLSNLISIFLISFFDRKIYPRYLTILTQSFTLQIVIFIASIPIYVTVTSLPDGQIILRYLLVFHLMLSGIVSSLLLEILSENVYKIVGLYGVALSALFTFVVVVFLHVFGLELFLLFVIPPVIWFSTELFRFIAEVLYYYFYKLYGIDALSTETELGEVVTEEEEEEEEEEPVKEDAPIKDQNGNEF